MFRAPLCPSSRAREYYTEGCCLWYLVLWFSSCRYGVELRVVCQVCGLLLLQQPANRTHNHIRGGSGPVVKQNTECIGQWVTECMKQFTSESRIFRSSTPYMIPRNLHLQKLHSCCTLRCPEYQEDSRLYASGCSESHMLQIPKAAGVSLCCYVKKTQSVIEITLLLCYD